MKETKIYSAEEIKEQFQKDKKNFNIQAITVWKPFENEFDEYKKFTNSDHKDYASMMKHLGNLGQQFEGLVPVEMSVKDFAAKLNEYGLPNTSEGRCTCSAMIARETNK